MRSSFFELNIGSYGLFAAQQGLSVTANNITNTNTTGYSRQVVRQRAGKALPGQGTGMVGTGVNVIGVERIRNSYLDTKIWNQKPTLGEYRTKTEHLSLIEGVFGEPSDAGFTAIFDDVFKSFSDLSRLPDEGERKFSVMQNLKGFTQYFKSTAGSIQKYQRDVNFEVKNKVDEINMITRRVESLNRQIFGSEIHGDAANTLRDERDLQIDRLAELINVEVGEYETTGKLGKIEKRFAVKTNGQTLVDHFHSRELGVKIRKDKLNSEDIEDLYDVVWKDGQRFDMDYEGLSGELKGAIDMRDGNGNLVVEAEKFRLDSTGEQITLTLSDNDRKDFQKSGHILVQGVKLKYESFEDIGAGEYTFNISPADQETLTNILKGLEPVGERLVSLGPASLEKTEDSIRLINVGQNPGAAMAAKGIVIINGKRVHYTSKTDNAPYSFNISKKDHKYLEEILAAELAPTIEITEEMPISELGYLQTITIGPNQDPLPQDGYILIGGKKVNYTTAEMQVDGSQKLTIHPSSYDTLKGLEEMDNSKAQILEDLSDPKIGEDPYTISVELGISGEISDEGSLLVKGEVISYTGAKVQDDGSYKLTIDPDSYTTLEKIQARGEDISAKLFKDLPSAEISDLVGVVTIDDAQGLPNAGSIIISGKRVSYTEIIEKDGKYQLIVDKDSKVTFNQAEKSTRPSAQIGEGQGYRGIPYYIHRLDSFVREFTMSMNGVYNEGVDESGQSGSYLFSFNNQTDADMQAEIDLLMKAEIEVEEKKNEPFALSDEQKEGIKNRVLQKYYAQNLTAQNLEVSRQIREDVSTLRTSKDPDKAPGGNDLLLDLMDLKHDRKMFKEGEPNDYMISIFSELGINTKEANMYNRSQSNMVEAIESQRLSVSQVDQNEEMLSLVKYQQAYQAAARIISTMDTIYDITINRLGAS